MKINDFALERYFARYEFSAPYLLSSSDCEALSQRELLDVADHASLDLWDKLSLGYTESQGHPLLREEIAGLYSKIKPENVLVITPEEGIFIAMNVILERGDHVIATFPGYQSLYEIAAALGCEVTHWMPHEENGWKFELEELKAALRPNTKLIVVNFPHNPTGSLIDRQSYADLIKTAGENGITVFSDEMYRLLEYEETERLDSACDLSESAVSLFGLSKSFALAGLRMGWLTTRDAQLYARLVAFKYYTTICGSAPSEILAIMALRARDEILRRNRGIVKQNLSLLGQFFDRYKDKFAWIKPRAGSIGFPRLLLPVDVADFCKDLVEKKGVMLLPSTVYDYDHSHFRIGFGRENLPQALEQLELYLRNLSLPT